MSQSQSQTLPSNNSRCNNNPSRSKSEPNPPSASARECSVCGYALYLNVARCTNRDCPKHGRKDGPLAITADRLIRDFEPPKLFHGRRWKKWVFDAERLCLVFEGRPTVRGEGANQYTGFFGSYEIDLELIRQSSQLLDWIFQVGHHRLPGLLDAFYSIFNPQRNLCSGGANKIIANATKFLKERTATVGDSPLKDAA